MPDLSGPDDLQFPTVQRSVVLSDQAWAAARSRAVLEHVSTSELCERLLRAYLDLSDKPAPVLLQLQARPKKRSVHISDLVWAGIREQATLEKRAISDLLEQLLRAYLGLDS